MPSSGMLRRVALFRRSVRGLLVTANVVRSSPIFVSLMIEALSSSETSVLTRTTRRNIPEDGILHSHRRENLKSYINIICSRNVHINEVRTLGPSLWSSGQSSWLLTRRSWVRFPPLPDSLSSSGSGTESTQPL
jgi:hypothetical protein